MTSPCCCGTHAALTLLRRFAAFLAVAVAVAAVAVATARSGPLAAAPAGIQGPGSTRLVVVNRDPVQSAVVVAEFFKQGIAAVEPVLLAHPGVPAGGSVSIVEPPELSNGAYAVIVSSDRSIGTSAVTHWPTSGGAIADDSAKASQEVVIPLVMINYVGMTSLISVHNTDTGQVATMTIEIFAQEVGTPVASKSYQIQPGSSATLDLARDPSFVGIHPNTPQGFLGSARISSAAELAVHVIDDVDTSQRSVFDHNGVPHAAGSPLLHVPLVVHGPGREPGMFEWTWLGVANTDAGPANVQVTYRGFGGTCDGQTFVQGPRTLPPLSMTLFGTDADTTPAPPLPDGCLASATIASDGATLAAVVVHHFGAGPNVTRWASATLAMPPSAAASRWIAWRWHRPLAADGGISEAIVHNPGANDATVALVLRDDNGVVVTGCGAPCRAVIPPGRTHRFTAAEQVALAAQFTGSAVVDSNAPVLVWLRDTFGGGGSDETLSAAVPAAPAGPGPMIPDRTYAPIYLRSGRGAPTPPARTATATPDPTATATATSDASTQTPDASIPPSPTATRPVGTATPDHDPTRPPILDTPSPVPSSTSTSEPTLEPSPHQRRTIHLPIAHRT